MTDDESFFGSLGLIGDMPPLDDSTWDRIVTVAVDPTTPDVDADLVPEQTDIPDIPTDDDGEIVLSDDDGDLDAPIVHDEPSGHHSTDDDPSNDHAVDDDGGLPDLGADHGHDGGDVHTDQHTDQHLDHDLDPGHDDGFY